MQIAESTRPPLKKYHLPLPIIILPKDLIYGISSLYVFPFTKVQLRINSEQAVCRLQPKFTTLQHEKGLHFFLSCKCTFDSTCLFLIKKIRYHMFDGKQNDLFHKNLGIWFIYLLEMTFCLRNLNYL